MQDEIKKFSISTEYYDKSYVNNYDFDKKNKINTILLKSTMGTGKTKSLKNIISKYNSKKIVIISFRVTLDKEYTRKFPEFELYSDIKETVYDTNLHDKMVIQIDSFYRIQGNIDLLILDEFTYTAMHLIERVKHKETVYSALLEYINNYNTKLIVMDALLDLNTIKYFYNLNRRIHYIYNKFKKHTDLITYNYCNKVGVFVDTLLENITNGKKIIIPTNSKNFLDNLEYKIKTKMPNIKCLFLNADTSDDINLENWNNYDVVGYTPTIVAGISFEKIHFDKCFGYFVNNSSPAEMSLQQLFRVRNLTDKEIHICTEKKDNIVYPISVEEIEKNIIDRNTCMVDGVLGIKISRINKTIKRDSYYYLYRDSQIKIFRSKNNYEEVLMKLLKNQGIYIKNVYKKDEESDKQLRKDIKETSTKCKEGVIKDIILAEEIEDEEYYLMKDKTNLSYIEKNRLKKKKFRTAYNYKEKITIDIYKKFNNKYRQFNNINAWYTLKDELKLYIKNNIESIENKKIEKIEEVENNDNESSEELFYPKKRKLITANTYILHQNKNFERFIIGLEILSIFGINDIFEKKEIKFNYKEVYNYIKDKEYVIRLLFKCKMFDINNITNGDNGIKEMIKYLNSRLRTVFNIYIKNNKGIYDIQGIDFWSNEINPLVINENIKMELLISKLMNNDFDNME